MSERFLHWLPAIASAFNPLLLLATLVITATGCRRKGMARTPFAICLGAALLIVFLLAHINRWAKLWPAHLLFPSGHFCFALGLATAICFCDWRWLPALAILLGAYGWLIVALGFHSWFDLAGSLALTPPVTWLILRAAPQQERQNDANP